MAMDVNPQVERMAQGMYESWEAAFREEAFLEELQVKPWDQVPEAVRNAWRKVIVGSTMCTLESDHDVVVLEDTENPHLLGLWFCDIRPGMAPLPDEPDLKITRIQMNAIVTEYLRGPQGDRGPRGPMLVMGSPGELDHDEQDRLA